MPNSRSSSWPSTSTVYLLNCMNFANFNSGPEPSKDDSANGVNPQAAREGILELTYNYGTVSIVQQAYLKNTC